MNKETKLLALTTECNVTVFLHCSSCRQTDSSHIGSCKIRSKQRSHKPIHQCKYKKIQIFYVQYHLLLKIPGALQKSTLLKHRAVQESPESHSVCELQSRSQESQYFAVYRSSKGRIQNSRVDQCLSFRAVKKAYCSFPDGRSRHLKDNFQRRAGVFLCPWEATFPVISR